VDNLWISAQVPHRALRAETPKLPYIKYPFSGVLFSELGRTGRAREKLNGERADFRQIFFARALDKSRKRHYITGAATAAGNRKDDMDWLLGLLIPLKWALVLIAVYFLIKLIF